jgi:LysM repeat protein
MSNKRRNRKAAKPNRQSIMGRVRAQRKLAANLTEEQDWYLDTPDVRLTRIFAVVVLLHAIAVGGILAFKMVGKATETSAIKISSARQEFETVVQEARETAAQVPVAVPADAPARQAVPAPLRPDPSKGEQYRVQTGETLVQIAAALGVTPEALRAKNSILSDHELYPGRWLTIPGRNEVPVAQAVPVATPVVAEDAPPAPASTTAPSAPTVYEVKAGDTPWAIARKFNVPFNKLMAENKISNAQGLQIGQKLRIPTGN